MLIEVARLVVDDGYALNDALHRAARRLNINLQRNPPSAQALHHAIRDHRELFRPDQQHQLTAQRRLALQAMQAFVEFDPRLTGSLVAGDGPLDHIRLIVTADTPEQILLQMHERRMPLEQAEVRMLFSAGRRTAVPAVRFMAGESQVEVVILGPESRSDPPRDPVSGGRLATLTREELERLLADAPG